MWEPVFSSEKKKKTALRTIQSQAIYMIIY